MGNHRQVEISKLQDRISDYASWHNVRWLHSSMYSQQDAHKYSHIYAVRFFTPYSELPGLVKQSSENNHLKLWTWKVLFMTMLHKSSTVALSYFHIKSCLRCSSGSSQPVHPISLMGVFGRLDQSKDGRYHNLYKDPLGFIVVSVVFELREILVLNTPKHWLMGFWGVFLDYAI